LVDCGYAKEFEGDSRLHSGYCGPANTNFLTGAKQHADCGETSNTISRAFGYPITNSDANSGYPCNSNSGSCRIAHSHSQPYHHPHRHAHPTGNDCADRNPGPGPNANANSIASAYSQLREASRI